MGRLIDGFRTFDEERNRNRHAEIQIDGEEQRGWEKDKQER
jgi:hypothetical protein